jgi:hypothetical protein
MENNGNREEQKRDEGMEIISRGHGHGHACINA